MAIPTFVASVGGDGAGTVTVSAPSGSVTGDIFLLCIEGEGEDTNADAPPTGGDWAAVDASTGSVASATDSVADRTRNSLYWHRYNSASPPNYVVPDAGQHTVAEVSAWRGCVATGSPIHKFQSSSSGTNDTSISITGVTTTVDDCLIVVFSTAGDNDATAYPGGSAYYSSWTNANLATPGITEAFDVGSNAGSDGAIGCAYGGLATAGASGTTTATFATSEEEANWCVALEPAADGGATTSFVTIIGGL